MSAIDALNVIRNGINQITVSELNIGDANTSYSFPTNPGTDGQFLTLNTTNELVWGSGAPGSGIQTITSSDGNITYSGTTSVALGLNPNISVEGVTIKNGDQDVLYDLPTTSGNAGEVLTLGVDGVTCEWQPNGGGTGTVTEVSSSDANISVATSTTTPVLTLNPDLSITSLTIGEDYKLPLAVGQNGQVLGVKSGQQTLVWLNQTNDGITAVNQGSNITVNPTGTTVTVELNSTLENMTTIDCTALDDGTINANILNYTELNLVSSFAKDEKGLSVPTVVYSMPITSGQAGDVITFPNSGTQCVWLPGGGGSSGVNSIQTTGANLSISPPGGTGNVQIDIGTTLETTNISAQNLSIIKNNNSLDYSLPIGTANVGDVVTYQGSGEAATWTTPKITSVSPNFRFPIDYPNELDLAGDILVTGSVSTVLFRQLESANDELGNPTTPVVAYDLPVAGGTAGQVITFPASGTQCTWEDGGSGGGVSSVSSSDTNISVTNGTTTPVLTLNQDLSVTTLSVESVNASTEVFGANVYATNLGISDDGNTHLFSMPVISATPAQNNIIVSNNSGGSVFNNVSSLLEAGTNIGITTDTNNKAIVALNNDIVVDNLTIGSSGPLVFPNTLEGVTDGYVLGNNGGSLAFIANGSGSGVSTITNNDGNLVITGSESVEIDLSTDISVTGSITAESGLTVGTSAPLVFPTTLTGVTNGYVLGNNSGSLGFISNGVTNVTGTTNQISVSNGSSSTVGLGFYNVINGFQTPYNIITNVSTQGIGSGIISMGPGSCFNIDATYTNYSLIALGRNSFASLPPTSGIDQISIGNDSSLYLNGSSNYNLVIGNQSMADITNTAAQNNVVVGHNSGRDISSSQYNIIVGNNSMSTTTSATTNVNSNIVIGYNSLQNVVGGGSHNIVLGNNVNLASDNDNGNFVVDPTNVTKFSIGNVLSGTAGQLFIPNFKNPFNVNPTSANSALLSDTSGNLSWSPTIRDIITNTSFSPTNNDPYVMNVAYVRVEKTVGSTNTHFAMSNGGAVYTVTGAASSWDSDFTISGPLNPYDSQTAYLGQVVFQERDSSGNFTLQGYASFYLVYLLGSKINMQTFNLNWEIYEWQPGYTYYFGVSSFIQDSTINFTW